MPEKDKFCCGSRPKGEAPFDPLAVDQIPPLLKLQRRQEQLEAKLEELAASMTALRTSNEAASPERLHSAIKLELQDQIRADPEIAKLSSMLPSREALHDAIKLEVSEQVRSQEDPKKDLDQEIAKLRALVPSHEDLHNTTKLEVQEQVMAIADPKIEELRAMIHSPEASHDAIKLEVQEQIRAIVQPEIAELRAMMPPPHALPAAIKLEVQEQVKAIADAQALRDANEHKVEVPAQTSDSTRVEECPESMVTDLEKHTRDNPSDQRQDYQEEEAVATTEAELLHTLPEFSRQLQESTWEVAVFIGMRCAGTGPSILALLAVVLNITVQLIFCMMVKTSLIGDELPDKATLEYWRTQAHDQSNTDPVTGMSLVSRVCGGDTSLNVAGEKAGFLEYADEYILPPLDFIELPSSGPILFTLSWLLWFMCAFQEAIATSEFVYTLLALPRGSTQLTMSKEGCVFRSISFARLVANLVIQSFRMAICFMLGYFGTLWLAETIGLSDLILNASALSFVMDLDEMIYNVAIPSIMQLMLVSLEPLPWPHYENGCLRELATGLGFRPFCVTLIAAITYIPFYDICISSNLNDLVLLQDTMCKGLKDFMYTHTEMSILLATRTTPFRDDFASNPLTETQDTLQKAAKQLWDPGFITKSSQAEFEDEYPTLEALAFMVDTLNAFTRFSEMSTESISVMPMIGKPDCASEDDWGDPKHVPQLLRGTLARKTGIKSFRGCKDLQHKCGETHQDFLRLSCPTQCGCRSPISGLYFGGKGKGCPVAACSRTDEYLAVMSSLACLDDQPDISVRNSWWAGWRRYWSEFTDAESASSGSFFEGLEMGNSSWFAHWAIIEKCEILQDPFVRYMFCFPGSDQVSPLTPFCPVSCGCIAEPYLEGCPPSCQIYDVQYREFKSSVPCTDASAESYANLGYSPFGFETFRRVYGSWRIYPLWEATEAWMTEFDVSGIPFLHNLWDMWGYVNNNGCQGLALYGQAAKALCVGELSSYGLNSMCPEFCSCTCKKRAACPDACYQGDYPATCPASALGQDAEQDDDQ